jgi:hypothetical protein
VRSCLSVNIYDGTLLMFLLNSCHKNYCLDRTHQPSPSRQHNSFKKENAVIKYPLGNLKTIKGLTHATSQYSKHVTYPFTIGLK